MASSRTTRDSKGTPVETQPPIPEAFVQNLADAVALHQEGETSPSAIAAPNATRPKWHTKDRSAIGQTVGRRKLSTSASGVSRAQCPLPAQLCTPRPADPRPYCEMETDR